MSDGDLIDLVIDEHKVKCPLCHQQTIHNWHGQMILFSTARCTFCDGEFIIALNTPQVGYGLTPRI
jgi:hypothetical protein